MTGIGVFMRKVFIPHLFPLGKNMFFPPPQLNCMYLPIHIYTITLLRKKGAVIILKPCPFNPKKIFTHFFCCGYQIMKFPDMK